jgi:hypothetical protein
MFCTFPFKGWAWNAVLLTCTTLAAVSFVLFGQQPHHPQSWNENNSMNTLLYDITIPALLRGLDNLSAQIDKAVAMCAERNIAEKILVDARLSPDMFAFARQVQIACDTAKFCIGRLSQQQAPSWADDEASFAELKARIDKTRDYLRAAKRQDIDGKESIELRFKAGPRELVFDGIGYVTKYVLPNFYFHSSISYAILRENGVPLGKMDFLGQIQ